MAASVRGKNGILPVPTTATRKSVAPQVSGRQPPKAGTPRLRLIIRRLPPGLTETEFWVAVGEEWKVGSRKVDWAAYKPGKMSKDPSKPSKPSRAYLKVKEPALLDELAAKVKQISFQDAKNTANDPCLLGPPSLEFALYTRVPGSRVRHDGRQGTIDQDQEFIDFLQSLTEPVGKPANDVIADGKQDKATTTPLVQYLKEKKAAKAKEAAAAKTAKAKEAKEGKSDKSGKTTVVVKNAPTSAEKARVAKATQDAVKAINKSVASMQGKGPPQKGDTKANSAVAAAKDATTPAAKPPRERGSAAVANRILQRDLGITPKESKSRAAKTSGVAKEADATSKSTITCASSNPPAGASDTATPTGPRNSRPPSTAAVKPNALPAARPAKTLPQLTPGAKSAFLKHANASQGVTEDLLRKAFEAFGSLTKCEIDKKKGFGYVDFAETEGLKNAMQASPVKVGNGQVDVLENKTRRPAPVLASAAPPTAAATGSTVVTETQVSSPTISSPSIGANTTNVDSQSAAKPNRSQPPPKAPRGTIRGGPPFNRGRGGFPNGRGNFPAGRAAPRGNFRGNRGGMRGAPNIISTRSSVPSSTSNASSAVPSTGGATESG